MSDARALVEEFLAGFGRSNAADRQMFEQYAAEEFVFDTGTRLLPDRAAVIQHWRDLVENYKVETFTVEVLNIAADGDVVLTERVDRVYSTDGHEVAAIPVSGTLEVRDGKIVAWRDYFDTARLAHRPEG